MTAAFLLTTFIVCLAPGLGVIYTLSMTLGGGLRAGLFAVLGCTLATVVHLIAALAGLAALLHASAVLFQVVKWAGVAYLLWMAWTMIQSTGTLEVKAERPHEAWLIVRRGITLNILNPKISIFFLAFLPQFITPSGDATSQLVTLGVGFVGMTGATFTLYALLAAPMRARVLSSERAMTWMRRVFAASFAALGLKLAFEQA